MSIEWCQIWGNGYEATGSVSTSNNLTLYRVNDSPRAGGGYIMVGWKVRFEKDSLTDSEKARLTTWLVDQRLQGNRQPEITEAVVESIKTQRPLPVHERADRLLKFIAMQTAAVGTPYEIRQEEPAVYAWSESVSQGEIGYLIDYLMKKGLLDARDNPRFVPFGDYRIPAFIRVTVDGHSRIEEKEINLDSSQAFVAMWFHDSMNEAYKKGVEPAIQDAGYTAFRIDQKEHLNKIDDEIIAEIRRSRFLVADFTYGDDGARGSVYFEAGFAHGLAIPVVYTCRRDMVNDLHFDTRQYPHITWDTPDDLRQGLCNRIRALIGEGPGLSAAR